MQIESSELNKNVTASLAGFSKLAKNDKIEKIIAHYLPHDLDAQELLKSFWHQDEKFQKIFDEFSENTISNFYFPFGVVPHFVLNDKSYCVPMVIEESSVVAACSRSANYWQKRGGFHARVEGTEKIGQVHFEWSGDKNILIERFSEIKNFFFEHVLEHTSNMEKRGGGVSSIELVDKTDLMENYFQLKGTFETCDAMGANFINTVLESWSKLLKEFFGSELDVIMSILSNYTPNSRVHAWVECPVSDLDDQALEMSGLEFAQKIIKAVKIAQIDVNRAATHNKGIFNGVDAVVMSTGNDFRAVEACGHAYASRSGQYQSLTHAKIENGIFKFWIDIPMSLGTVGGLTSLHPLSKLSLSLLKNPSAPELMMIAAAIGLAQNFGALRSLVTSGIQKGHMKMHLVNILNSLNVTDDEKEKAKKYFAIKTVSFKDVRDFVQELRQYH
jgi:hydroxymethylglutaryl-CoA reductase